MQLILNGSPEELNAFLNDEPVQKEFDVKIQCKDFEDFVAATSTVKNAPEEKFTGGYQTTPDEIAAAIKYIRQNPHVKQHLGRPEGEK